MTVEVVFTSIYPSVKGFPCLKWILLGVTNDDSLSSLSLLQANIFFKENWPAVKNQTFLRSSLLKTLLYSTHARTQAHTQDAHVLSTLDYNSTLWNSGSGAAASMSPFASIQKRAIKAKTKIRSNDFASIRVFPLTNRL